MSALNASTFKKLRDINEPTKAKQELANKVSNCYRDNKNDSMLCEEIRNGEKIKKGKD